MRSRLPADRRQPCRCRWFGCPVEGDEKDLAQDSRRDPFYTVHVESGEWRNSDGLFDVVYPGSFRDVGCKMQNIAASCTRESWTKRFRAPDHHIEPWRLCYPAATSSDSKISKISSQENNTGDNLRTSADAKMLSLESIRGQMFYQYNEVDYDKAENLIYENVLPALNAGTIAWSTPSYCNIAVPPANGTTNVLCTDFKTTQYDAAKAVLNVNAHSQELEAEWYTRPQAAAVTVCDQTHSISEVFLTSGCSVKMEEFATLNGISIQTASTKPSFQSSNDLSFSTEESAPVASSNDLHQVLPRQTDECEESPPAEHKRTSFALDDGDQESPSKRIRTSDAPLKGQVRKEKLGERITALQQLVSPFGKTDTASVLLEAIGYIKFLQDQVQVLSTPYVKGFPSGQTQEGSVWDSGISLLRRRGLCVVPVSCTQLAPNNNGADFWASGIGGGTRF